MNILEWTVVSVAGVIFYTFVAGVAERYVSRLPPHIVHDEWGSSECTPGGNWRCGWHAGLVYLWPLFGMLAIIAWTFRRVIAPPLIATYRLGARATPAGEKSDVD